MLRSVVVALTLVLAAMPALGKTHNDTYQGSCSELWNAVQDTIKNGGYYTLVLADPNHMTIAFNISGAIHSRTISTHLEPQGSGCEMQTQTAFSGLMQNDAGDFKSRIDKSLAKLKGSNASAPTLPAEPGK